MPVRYTQWLGGIMNHLYRLRVARCGRVALAASVVLSATMAAAAADPAVSCRAAKTAASGKYYACLQGVQKKFLTNGDATKQAEGIAKCDGKLSDAWQKAEQKALDQNGSCAPTGDEARMQGAIVAQTACNRAALEGDTACLTCGDGVLDPGEECDFGTVGTATCASATANALPGGELGCGPGCQFDTSECDPCSGEYVGGYCWYLGASGSLNGDSCDYTCQLQGKVYDPATKTFAGSDGTNANCALVLDALGVPSGILFSGSGSGPFGCFVAGNGDRVRSTDPTDSSSGNQTVKRACACQ